VTVWRWTRASLVVVLVATALGVVPRAEAEPTLADVLGLAVQRLGLDDLAPGAATTIDTTAESVLLSWDGPAEHVLVRRHGAEGWGEWVEASAAPDEAPDTGSEGSPSGRTIVGPVWTGPGTDAVEVRAADGTLTGLQVELLDDLEDLVRGLLTDPVGTIQGVVRDVLAPLQPTPPSPGPGRPGPPILPTSAWASPGWSYSTPGCENGPQTAPLSVAIVHHTVQANGYGPDDVPALLRSVYYGHLARGWCDVGYNFLVDAYGRIWQGRSGPVDRAVIGGHARGHNTGSIGVATIGQHHPGASPPAAGVTEGEMAGVAAVIGWQFHVHGVSPNIVGHRDVGATACPGDFLYDRIGELYERLGQW
jgi:hypothetical protein